MWAGAQSRRRCGREYNAGRASRLLRGAPSATTLRCRDWSALSASPCDCATTAGNLINHWPTKLARVNGSESVGCAACARLALRARRRRPPGGRLLGRPHTCQVSRPGPATGSHHDARPGPGPPVTAPFGRRSTRSAAPGEGAPDRGPRSGSGSLAYKSVRRGPTAMCQWESGRGRAHRPWAAASEQPASCHPGPGSARCEWG